MLKVVLQKIREVMAMYLLCLMVHPKQRLPQHHVIHLCYCSHHQECQAETKVFDLRCLCGQLQKLQPQTQESHLIHMWPSEASSTEWLHSWSVVKTARRWHNLSRRKMRSLPTCQRSSNSFLHLLTLLLCSGWALPAF